MASIETAIQHISFPLLLTGALLGTFLLSIVTVLTRVLRGSLRSIPGPWYTKFTGVWLTKYTLTSRRLHYIHNLHSIYGPVVRIAPSEVDVSDLEGFQEIHKIGSGFLKSPWYQKFRTGQTYDVFSMIDPKLHAAKRRILAQPFSNSSLRQNWEKAVVEKVKSTVMNIKKDADQGNADIMK